MCPTIAMPMMTQTVAFKMTLVRVRGGLVISLLDCSGFKSQPGQKFGSRFLLTSSAMMSILTVICQWEGEMVRERIGHLSSYVEAKK